MNKKQRKWLDTIKICSDGGGMYAGLQQDMVPTKAANVLYRAGFIEPVIPHNPVHKERWAITAAGRAALSENP